LESTLGQVFFALLILAFSFLSHSQQAIYVIRGCMHSPFFGAETLCKVVSKKTKLSFFGFSCKGRNQGTRKPRERQQENNEMRDCA
jgi:hypothetical protein